MENLKCIDYILFDLLKFGQLLTAITHGQNQGKISSMQVTQSSMAGVARCVVYKI